MKIKVSILILIAVSNQAYSQISANSQTSLLGYFWAKEFSKEVSLYNAKTFLVQNILSSEKSVIRFEMDALVASNSGELTTLVYKCESQKKSGLILGFYGNRWNDAGVTYQAYAFKDLPMQTADSLISVIDFAIDNNYKYIDSDADVNNIYFTFKDISILVFKSFAITKLRVYWNGFDSEWNYNEFKKTKSRLAKKLK